MYIALIHGGTSAEQAVSTLNASYIQTALDALGHETAMLCYDASLLCQLQTRRPDLAFVCVQGKGHGDGTVQGLLDFLGIPYTGSGREAATLINNKIYCQTLFAAQGLPVPNHFAWGHKSHAAPDGQAQFLAQMQASGVAFPCMAKAPTQGGSFGIACLHSIADYALMEAVFGYDNPILIETFIKGEFYTVSLLAQGQGLRTLPATTAVDTDGAEGFVSFTGHYTPQKAELPPALQEAMGSYARQAFHLLGAAGYARVDFILCADTGVPMMLEINAVPGLKPQSLFPCACRDAGILYQEMVQAIVEAAMKQEENDA